MRIGIDFGGTNIKFGVFSESGRIVSFQSRRLKSFTGTGDLLDNIIAYASEVIGDKDVKKGGFCIKGLVIPDTGVMDSDVGAGDLFRGINMKDAFSTMLKIPFSVDNDARAYAYGEWIFGAGRGSTSMLCITLGTGIGTSRIVDGRLYFGDNILEGLLGGHMSIDRYGPECPCGNRGCLEYYCSATGLASQISEAFPELQKEGDVIPPFFKMIESGIERYRGVLDIFLDNLTIGLLNLIHAYQPELIVLGGGLLKSGHLWLPELKKRVVQQAWTYPRGRIRIKTAEMPDQAASIGIAFFPSNGGSHERS